MNKNNFSDIILSGLLTGKIIMNNIKIRQMKKTDIDQIMKIESVIFGEFHWRPDAFISEVENEFGNYFVAIDEESFEIIGYCGFWLIMDEGHITTLAVKPSLRNKGLGEMMIQKMIETGYEKKVKWFTLEVRASNIPAQNLYYKYGFKSLGLRKKYYQDNGEDALIMWTENIWDDNFKSLYKSLKVNLKNKIAV